MLIPVQQFWFIAYFSVDAGSERRAQYLLAKEERAI